MPSLMYTTNYHNAFIEAAEDCPAIIAEIPPQKGDYKTIANLHFDMIAHHPYRYTSDDVIFNAYAQKNYISKDELNTERKKFFSKGQPCLRTSPLAKRYGWGIHSNEAGKVALYAIESNEYKKLAKDRQLEHVKAMRSKRVSKS